jgi:hypothetical protein
MPLAVTASRCSCALSLPNAADTWSALHEGAFGGTFFMFECRSCRELVAHWDCD